MLSSEVLRDDPVEQASQDCLSFSHLVRLISKRILKSGDGRADTCAIFGPWGSGKTSLLNIVRETCGQQVKWVSFDALRYQAYGNVLMPLLHELARNIGTNRAWDSVKIMMKATASFLRHALFPALPGGQIAGKAIDLVTDLRKELDSIDALPALPPSPADAIHSCFTELIGQLRGDQKRRVVIAVDNLDRCRPEAVLEAVEAIHLVLTVSGCTFLVAVDQDVLVSFINQRYQGTAFQGAQYLEKVFPDYYRIPDLWIAEEFADKNEEPDDVQRLLRSMLRTPACSKIDEYEESLWRIVSSSRALRNPRRIKRLIRRLALVSRGYWNPDSEALGGFLFLIALSDVWPHMFRSFLYADPDDWSDFIDAVLDLEPLSEDEGEEVIEDEETDLEGETAEDAHDDAIDGEDELDYVPSHERLAQLESVLQVKCGPEFREFVLAVSQWQSQDNEFNDDLYAKSYVWQWDKLYDLLDHLRKIGL